jgi:trehalose 6-phosphate synthase/phosphatase
VVPSRETVPEYQDLRGEIEQLVSQVNGQFTEPGWVPIQHMFRSIDRDELIASYRVADIALVTPLKDGMNLVAKEYCACQTDGDGTLILSEFAGAAFQFRRNALLVNPYDIQTVADSILLAATMPRRERVRRMKRLRQNVRTEDVYWWVRRFLECSGIRIDATTSETADASGEPGVPIGELGAGPTAFAPTVLSFEEALAAAAAVPVLLVASDFDGTVSPIVSDPGRAEAGAASLTALEALSRLPHTHVAVISGRALADLAPRMVTAPGVELVGGHGTEFASGFVEPLTAHAERFLDQISAEAALIEHEFRGMFLERKPASLAVHYRNVEEHLHDRAEAAILAGPARHESLHVRRGKKVIELSVLRADKGGALERIRDRVGASAVVFIGDDVTDEDAFAALSGPDLGVKVGPGDTMARHRVDTTDDVAKLLHRILELRRG